MSARTCHPEDPKAAVKGLSAGVSVTRHVAHAEVSSGLISKSSSATYGLKLRIRRLEAFGDVLGAITSQRNVQVQQVEWGYLEDDARRDGWLVLCAQKAGGRAKLLAAAMGVDLLGVHSFHEGALSEEESPQLGNGYSAVPKRRAVRSYMGSMTSDELGLQVTHTRKVGVQVLVKYRIGQSGQKP